VSVVEEKFIELQRVYGDEYPQIAQKLRNMIETFIFQTTSEKPMTLP
jgi:hypothetical protein